MIKIRLYWTYSFTVLRNLNHLPSVLNHHPSPHIPRLHLQQEDRQHPGADAVHQAHVVADQGLAAAAVVQVELLGLVLVVVVGRVVGQPVLDAGPRGAGVAAAEGDPVHQIAPVYIAPDATAGQRI